MHKYHNTNPNTRVFICWLNKTEFNLYIIFKPQIVALKKQYIFHSGNKNKKKIEKKF